jgi:hypothetical protein
VNSTLEIRLRQTGIPTAVANKLQWSTSGHGFSDSYYMSVEVSQPGIWETLTLDMSSPTAGGSDWSSNTITGLKLCFDAQDLGEAYEIAFIRIVHDTSKGWETKPTSNPAWIFAEIMTGSANHKAVSTDRLDVDGLVSFASKCTDNGYEYNGTIAGPWFVGINAHRLFGWKGNMDD